MVAGSYRPSQAVLDQLTGLDVVVVVGPTGVGKTTLIDAAVAQDPAVRLIPSDMSRHPRPGERDSIDCNFRSREEMLAYKERGEYVNVAQGLNGGDIYATHPNSFPREGIGIMPLFSDVVPEFRALPFGSLKVLYVLPPSWTIWQERMNTRDFTSEQRQRRLEEARQSLEFALRDTEVLFLVNDDLRIAQQVFNRIIQHGPIPKPLEDTQALAKNLAGELLEALKVS